ncbi:MAG: shikimate kinase [Betaproteobacteria bacterium]|nr:shikimate kinase [Betaproteobacteria bacterium]
MRASRNLFLVGLMGAGKTTVGRQLARRLGKRFLDSDHEIEERTGVKVATIFEIEGETGFRARESRVIEELAQAEDLVLATGGGVVLDPGNRARLAARGFVIYLHAQPRDLWQRTRQDKSRPLLQGVDPLARLEQLYAIRDPLYREIADIVVDTGRQGVGALVTRVLGDLPDECKLSA